jgi:hypothetical protein
MSKIAVSLSGITYKAKAAAGRNYRKGVWDVNMSSSLVLNRNLMHGQTN